MNDFVRHHRELIRFGYHCFDRMLCNVMIQRLQWPAAVTAEAQSSTISLTLRFFRWTIGLVAHLC
jgi:hypothetical protein